MTLMPMVSATNPLPSLSFLQATEDIANSTVYTFASQSFGAAHPSRLLACLAFFAGNGADRTLASATIGGVSATIVVQNTDTTPINGRTAALIQAEVPTGTSGDVVITASGSCLRCGIALYRIINLKSATAEDTTGTVNDPLAHALSISKGAAVIVGGVWDGPGVVATSGDGSFAEDFDQTLDTGDRMAGGSSHQEAADLSYSVVLNGDNVDAASAGAAWR